MRGKQRRDEPMFACVRLEDLVPGDHILRKIDEAIDFGCIDEATRDLYSHTGRPSIDPEVLIRMMVIGYLYGITSERRLCEEVQLNLAYRWFCRLNLEDKVPNHSSFSKNRHGRFSDGALFRTLFYSVVGQAQSAGLVRGHHLSVDASTVDANAAMSSLTPIVVEMEPEAYVDEVEKDNPVGEPAKHESNDDDLPRRTNDTHRSKTDPDARLLKKRWDKSRLCYSHNVLMDNAHRIILDVEVTQPQYALEGEAAAVMVTRSRFALGIKPKTLGGDKAYGTGEALRRLFEAGVQPHVPDPGRRNGRQKGIFARQDFEYDEQADEMICPAGKRLHKKGDLKDCYTTQYIARRKDCGCCELKKQCTRGRQRVVSRHWDAEYMDRARALRGTEGYKKSQRCRKKIEHLFGEAKEQMGLRKAIRRGDECMLEQSRMTAMVQNIKRIVAAIHRSSKHPAESNAPDPIMPGHIVSHLQVVLNVLSSIRCTNLRISRRPCFC